MGVKVKVKVQVGRSKAKAKLTGKKAEEILQQTILPMLHRQESRLPAHVIIRENTR